MDYTVLTDTEKLNLARERLRGLEMDYFRLSLTPDEPGIPDRLKVLEKNIASVRKALAALETPPKSSKANK